LIPKGRVSGFFGWVREVDHRPMVIDMSDGRVGTLGQLRRFLDGTLGVQFVSASDAASRYGHLARVVQRVGYAHLPRTDKPVVLRQLGPTSGNGPAQAKRTVARAMAGEPLVRRYRAPPQACARRYSEADVGLLAAVDTALGTLSEPRAVRVAVAVDVGITDRATCGRDDAARLPRRRHQRLTGQSRNPKRRSGRGRRCHAPCPLRPVGRPADRVWKTCVLPFLLEHARRQEQCPRLGCCGRLTPHRLPNFLQSLDAHRHGCA
jgi:hypothetical protein